jgi:hypothetical protein
MLYTMTSPAEDYDRILLYPSIEAARAVAGSMKPVHLVDVDYDEMMRRVIPLRTDPQAFDPDWSTPAQPHADGTVTAKGPIPEFLFRL